MRNFYSRLKVRNKLLIVIFIVGSIPLGVAHFIVAYSNSKILTEQSHHVHEVVEKEVFGKLEGIAHSKKLEIQRYFDQIRDQVVTFAQNRMVIDAMRDFPALFDNYAKEMGEFDVEGWRSSVLAFYRDQYGELYKSKNLNAQAPNLDSPRDFDPIQVALQYQYISANPNPLGGKEAMDRAADSTAYSDLHAHVHPSIRAYLAQFGYYDIFLVEPENGKIVYSVFKELDYATSLIDGPYANTNFAEVFREARKLTSPGEFVFRDFKQYTPSYEDPASFIGAPVFDGSKLVGVAIFQMPLDTITTVMAGRSGLGETGDVYLVGDDGRLRSDSHLHADTYNVRSSFRNPDKSIQLTAVDKALAGERGAEIGPDVNGDPVLAAFTPIKAFDRRWALIAKKSADESLKSARELDDEAMENAAALSRIEMASLGFGWIAAVLVLAILLGRMIVKPLQSVVQGLKKLADGDLTVCVEPNSQDEFAELCHATSFAAVSLRASIIGLRDQLNLLSRASGQILDTSHKIAEEAGTTSSQATSANTASGIALESVESVSSAASQLEEAVQEISNNVQSASADAAGVTSRVSSTRETVDDLENQSQEINSVVQLISSVAEQTNLLALNATIESARAGDAGKGFAVVAGEVKELASGTSSATDQIAQKIAQMQSGVSISSSSMSEVVVDIDRIASTQTSIAGAVEEQLATVNEISRSVHQATAQCSEVSQRFEAVMQAATGTTQYASELEDTAEELKEVSGNLLALFQRLQVG